MTAESSAPPVYVERHNAVFVMHLANGENRWNTTFVRAIDSALDEIEQTEGKISLVITSDNEKFFSNGLDLKWITSRGKHPGGDRKVFNPEVMQLFARLMTFPIPTVCSIGGHCFGAGFMIALCCDVRFMREDKGFLCANEIELGFAIPEPELALFRHKLPINAFFDTVQLAKRWSGPAALSAGIVHQISPATTLLGDAMKEAGRLAKKIRSREVFKWQKEHIFGENAAINGLHGAAYMLRNQQHFAHGPGKVPEQPPKKSKL
jgi:enoyl-CoA hydratase/carnithine racemase